MSKQELLNRLAKLEARQEKTLKKLQAGFFGANEMVERQQSQIEAVKEQIKNYHVCPICGAEILTADEICVSCQEIEKAEKPLKVWRVERPENLIDACFMMGSNDVRAAAEKTKELNQEELKKFEETKEKIRKYRM